MTLSTATIGESYELASCDVPPKTRNKLETLGLVPGERITIIQKTRSGLIIEVKNSRLAIAHDLAKNLCTREDATGEVGETNETSKDKLSENKTVLENKKG